MTLSATSPHKPFFFVVGTDESTRRLVRGDVVPRVGDVLFLHDGKEARVHTVSHTESLGVFHATAHYVVKP
jgi:hypothetical protein